MLLIATVEVLESSAEQIFDFLIGQAELAKDAQYVDGRELTNPHVDWYDALLTGNNAHVQTMISPSLSIVTTASQFEKPYQFPWLKRRDILRHIPPAARKT